MIFGGFIGGESSSARKSYVRQIRAEGGLQLMAIERQTKQLKLGCPPITFSANDARGVSQPYDDPLVVTLVVSNYLSHGILIDNGSSVDILYLPAFDHMGIGRDKLQPVQTPLIGFTGDQLLSIGMIGLPVTAGIGECQTT